MGAEDSPQEAAPGVLRRSGEDESADQKVASVFWMDGLWNLDRISVEYILDGFYLMDRYMGLFMMIICKLVVFIVVIVDGDNRIIYIHLWVMGMYMCIKQVIRDSIIFIYVCIYIYISHLGVYSSN